MSTIHDRSLELLRKAAEQFRFYEKNHRAKVEPWRNRLTERGLPLGERETIDAQICDTIGKADVNAAFATELENHIATLEDDAA